MHSNVWHVAFTTSDVSTRSLPGWLEGSIKPSNMKAINKLWKKKKKREKMLQKLPEKLGAAHSSNPGLRSWSACMFSSLTLASQTETTRILREKHLLKMKMESLSTHVCSLKQPLKFWGSSNTAGNLYIPPLNCWSWRFHLYTSPENTETSIKLLHVSLVEVRSPCAAFQLA